MIKYKFKQDYCRGTVRKKFNTTLSQQLIDELKLISKHTGFSVSRMIETSLYQHLQNQETFDQFMELVKNYDGE
jgi:hypothetical protein